MSQKLESSLEACFGDLPDPRVKGRCDHKLIDIIIIAICGVLCGADSWVGIETVGKAKEGWFRQFLELELCPAFVAEKVLRIWLSCAPLPSIC